MVEKATANTATVKLVKENSILGVKYMLKTWANKYVGSDQWVYVKEVMKASL